MTKILHKAIKRTKDMTMMSEQMRKITSVMIGSLIC